jgi:alpha-glucosidase
MELIEYHKEIIRIHKDYQAMKTGSILFLHGQYQFICYGRFDEQDKIVVAINSGDQPVSVDIPVWRIGLTEANRMARLMSTSRDGFSIETGMYTVDHGILHLNCPPEYGVIIKNFA